MTWERFGYICRRASVDRQENESLSECLSRIDRDKASALYGPSIALNALPRKILSHLGCVENEKEALEALKVYKELNLSKHFEEPIRFKRVIAYLVFITFMFYVVVGTYQLKVTPVFFEAFEDLGVEIPSNLAFYQDYWIYFVIIISVLLFASLLIGYHFKKLFKFIVGQEDSWIVRFLVFPIIRKSYLRIVNILQFPLLASSRTVNGGIKKSVDSDSCLVVNHLSDVKKTELDLSREMQELIEIEMRILLENCEKQLKYISIFIAAIIVCAIFLFLVSAYSPLFMFGDSV